MAAAAMAGADFSGANLWHAVFNTKNLSGASFRGASLDGASLAAVDLTGADLSPPSGRQINRLALASRMHVVLLVGGFCVCVRRPDPWTASAIRAKNALGA
jgi:hypothetical protein